MNNLIIKQKYHNYYFLGTDNNNNYYLEDISLKSDNHYYINHIQEYFEIIDSLFDNNHFVLTKNKLILEMIM